MKPILLIVSLLFFVFEASAQKKSTKQTKKKVHCESIESVFSDYCFNGKTPSKPQRFSICLTPEYRNEDYDLENKVLNLNCIYSDIDLFDYVKLPDSVSNRSMLVAEDNESFTVSTFLWLKNFNKLPQDLFSLAKGKLKYKLSNVRFSDVGMTLLDCVVVATIEVEPSQVLKPYILKGAYSQEGMYYVGCNIVSIAVHANANSEPLYVYTTDN